MSDPGVDVEVEELLFFDTFSHEMSEVRPGEPNSTLPVEHNPTISSQLF